MMLERSLIRDGTDQCRVALKRFESKRGFRLHQKVESISKRNWEIATENLDLKLDQLDEDVESI